MNDDTRLNALPQAQELRLFFRGIRREAGVPSQTSLRRRTLSQVLLVSSAQASNQLSTFVILVLVARALGPVEFGLFSVALATVSLLSQFPGIGLDLSAMRLSSMYIDKNPIRSKLVLQMAGLLKVVSALTLSIVVLIVAVFVEWMGAKNWIWPLCLGAIGGFAMAMSTYIVSTLQSREQHVQAAIVLLVSSVLKMAPVVILFYLSQLSLLTASLAYLLGLLTTVVGILTPGARFMLAVREVNKGVLIEICHYAKWAILANVFGIMLISTDVYFLSALSGHAEAGIYSSARTLAIGVAILSTSALTVLLPKAGRITDGAQLLRFIVRAEILMLVLCTLPAIEAVFAPTISSLLYGDIYSNGLTVIRVLILAYGIELLITPMLVFTLSRNRPDVLAVVNGAGLCVALIGFVLVIPSYGGLGASFVFLASRIVIALLNFLWVFRTLARPTWSTLSSSHASPSIEE